MIVNTNVASLNAQRSLLGTNNAMQKSLEKLSSGSRINRAADDAAGLAMSEKMRGQIKGLNQAVRNSQSAISLIQTAEGALNETHSILQRMRELAVQSSSDTNTNDDRSKIQSEMDQLSKEVTRISNNTEFNTQKLINGAIGTGNIGELNFHIGANENQSLSLDIGAMDAKTLGVSRDIATGTVSGATDVTSASLSGSLGTGIANGASLTLSASIQTAGTVATAGAIGGITYVTADNSDTLNGFTITISNGAVAGAEVATVDAGNKTISLQIDDAAATKSTAAQINTALNAALTSAGITDVDFAATGTVTDDAGTGSGTIAGGAQDTVRLSLTDGALTETVDVAGNASSAAFTDSTRFAGLSVTLSGNLSSGAAGAAATSTAATITIGKTSSTAATFSNAALANEAVTAGGIDVSSQSAANTSITAIDNAINTVSEERSKLGAMQNRLEHTINNLQTASENMTSAESRIRDVDMAAEMSAFTKSQILSQAGVAMLAQANQVPQAVLKLLG